MSLMRLLPDQTQRDGLPATGAGAPATGETVILVVCGEVDLASAPALEQTLRNAEREVTREIVIDLAGVTFMDSTGLHLLLDARDRASHGGYRLRYRNIPPQAERLFEIAGSIDRFLSPAAA